MRKTAWTFTVTGDPSTYNSIEELCRYKNISPGIVYGAFCRREVKDELAHTGQATVRVLGLEITKRTDGGPSSHSVMVDPISCPECGSEDGWNGQMCSDCGWQLEAALQRMAITIPDEYYAIGKIDSSDVYRYDFYEAAQKVVDIGTYGPWEHALNFEYREAGIMNSSRQSNRAQKMAWTQTVSDDGDFAVGDVYNFGDLYFEITEIQGNDLFLECLEGDDPDFPVWVESRELRQDLKDNGMWFEGSKKTSAITPSLIERWEDDKEPEDHYQVGLYDFYVTYREDGSIRRVAVDAPTDERYLPDIYYSGRGDKRFEIQTTSYGALSVGEIEQVIDGYHYAIDAVEAMEGLLSELKSN